MDYALSNAMMFFSGIQTLLVMYDIACQYSKKAEDRFQEGRAHLTWPEACIIFWAIGLFHIHGHQRDCFAKYAPNFIPGAGQVDGEIIETLWSPLNRIAGSTRAMSTSHRKEVIDDHMNDANWRKTVGMGTSHVLSRPGEIVRLPSCSENAVKTVGAGKNKRAVNDRVPEKH